MTFKWGLIGSGKISAAFAKDLLLTPDLRAHAIGSRSQENADRFAAEHGIPKSYASYEALVEDPEIDAVYVATPHPAHAAATILALEAGKPVLCEKVFAMNVSETMSMINAAKVAKLTLMEAMWTRFLPHIHQIRALLAAGTIGEIISVEADHGQWFAHNPQFRLFNPELGGGALLDLGIYPVSFAHMVLGSPTAITAKSRPAFTGVDATTSAIFQYASGAHANLSTTLLSATSCTATINGTEGRIEIDRTFYAPTSYRVILRGADVIERPRTYEGHGLREEALEFARCVRNGELESPYLPLNETLEIMKSMDEIRNQIGLKYDWEH